MGHWIALNLLSARSNMTVLDIARRPSNL
jgi:hypothetical protein